MERPSPGAAKVEYNPEVIQSAIDRVKSGDKQAFAILIREFEKKIYTYCFCMLKSREGAEDAVQDIFIKTYQNLARYEKQASFSTWLYKIAYHHCLDQLRKQSRWQQLISLYRERQSILFSSYDHKEQAIQELLMPLNREERNILLLKVVEQYSFEEMGQIMDCKPATLRQKYARLRKKLLKQKAHKGGRTSGEMARRI
ncbi:RNA polymerase sigma factor [Paenibacillus elgii]